MLRTALLLAAASILLVAGVIHSVLGERLVLPQLIVRDEGGSRGDFTLLVVRAAWHAASISWWGFAALLLLLLRPTPALPTVAAIIGVTFVTTAAMAGFIEQRLHFNWVVLLAVGVFALLAAR